MRSSILAILGWVAAPLAVAWQEPPAQGERGARPLDHALASTGAGYDRRHALVIGINKYADPGFPDLSFALADARGLAEVLVKRLGFAAEDVRLIEDGGATKAALDAALQEWLCDQRRVGENDLVVVFFAGHGLTRTLDQGRKRGYLVPADGRRDARGEPAWSTLLSTVDLEETSENIPAKHVLFIIDCCFSGLAVERAAPIAPLVGGLTTAARNVITAGTGEQTVLDSGGGEHSIFTAAMLEGIKGAADTDGDGAVTFGELFGFVSLRLEAQTLGRQTPVLGTLPGHKGGQVALFPPDIKATGLTAKERLERLRLDNDQYREEISRLKDTVTAADLLEQDAELWPRRPEQVTPMRDWLAHARQLLRNQPLLEEARTRAREETRLTQVVDGTLSEATGAEPIWSQADTELRWRFDVFSRALDQLAKLAQRAAAMEERLRVAESIEFETTQSYRQEWRTAITAIAEDPQYDGLELEPIVGLVPLGRDPHSLLWEFWHHESGTRPIRDPNTDRHKITADSGLVMVLLPGGVVSMGARKTTSGAIGTPYADPFADAMEGPVHEVELAPFFISKYEMTQGQWLRFTGENPSGYGPGSAFGDKIHDLTHPVEQVSWYQCEQTLRRLGLCLPTEAQWEYAARAGTTTIWWTGDDKASIAGAANLADRFAKRCRGELSFVYDLDFDDGYTMHAPVGRYRANAFGLHDTMGNVWEWCRDWYGGYQYPAREGDRERLVPEPFHRSKISRGGGYMLDTQFLRSAFREHQNPNAQVGMIGVRPALCVAGNK